MIRLIALLIFLTIPVVANGFGVQKVGTLGGPAAGGAFSCSDTPFITQDTSSSGVALGSASEIYYLGIVNTGSSNLSICAISIYSRQDGDLSGTTLSVEKWSATNPSYVLDTKISTVKTVDGDVFPTTIGLYKLSFDTTIVIEPWQALVFTFNEVTGAVNKLTFAYSKTSSTIPDQSFGSWNSDGSLGHSPTVDSANDIRGRFYGE